MRASHTREWIATAVTIGAIALASRLAMLAVGAIVLNGFAHGATPGQTGWSGLLCRWDCGWYLGVAEHGYSALQDPAQPGATNFAFFPLYPLLVRYAAPLFAGNLLIAAIAVSNLSFWVALVYVYRYARLLACDHRIALLAVGLICILPQSIAFSSVMSESVFLLLLVMAMYHLRRGQYLAAGLAAALLSATRAPGILFVIFALAWLIRQDDAQLLVRSWRAPERLLPLALAPLGLFAFWAYCFTATGDAFAQASTAHHGWYWSLLAPWTNIPVMLRSGGATMLAGLGGMLMLGCVAGMMRRGLVEDAVFCLAAILLVLSGGGGTVSAFRYWIVLFPAWIFLARLAAARPLANAALFSLAGFFNGLMMCAWTLQEPIAM